MDEWAKVNKLRRTDLVTMTDRRFRRVYRAKDGRLYYRYANHWCGTAEEYCVGGIK